MHVHVGRERMAGGSPRSVAAVQRRDRRFGELLRFFHREAGQDAVLRREHQFAVTGIFASASSNRERIAYHAPGMCPLR